MLHGDKSRIYQSCHNRFLSRHKLMNRFEAKNNCVIVDHSCSNNLLNLYREVNIFSPKFRKKEKVQDLFQKTPISFTFSVFNQSDHEMKYKSFEMFRNENDHVPRCYFNYSTP